jgi:hypothetical protein
MPSFSDLAGLKVFSFQALHSRAGLSTVICSTVVCGTQLKDQQMKNVAGITLTAFFLVIHANGGQVRCPKCGGEGKIPTGYRLSEYGRYMKSVVGVSGEVPEWYEASGWETCPDCGGTGYINGPFAPPSPRTPSVNEVLQKGLPAAGTPYLDYPHVVWAEDGKIKPAEGYRFISTGPSDYRAEPIPAGTAYANHPNVVWTGDGIHVQPVDGYRFISSNPASTGDYRVEPITISLTPANQTGSLHASDPGVPPPTGSGTGGPGREQQPPVIDIHRLFQDPRIASGLEVIRKMNLDGFKAIFREVAKHSDARVEEMDVRVRSAEGQVDMARDVFDALRKVAAGNLTQEEARKIQSLDSQLVINLFRKICDDPSLKVENYRKEFESGKK